MTGKVLRSVKKKHKLWRKCKQSNDQSAEAEYKKQANKASKVVRLAKRDFERIIAKNIKEDSKTFFKYAWSKTTVKSSAGPLDNNRTLVSDDQEMGQMLNTFFASVFTTECQDDLPTSPTIFHGSEEDKLNSYHISPSMVKAKLLKLKMNKSPGVDLVGMRMLMELAEERKFCILLLNYLINLR